jgi:ferredoxin-NADP reductase/nitrite reductase/ring-hydroxylating ferredoxin subunit
VKAKGMLAAQVDGHELALFAAGDEVHCVDGLCPHEGAPLAQGTVADGVVVCLWHGWAFHTSNGCSADGNGCHLKSHPARLENGRVLISWPADMPPATAPAAAAESEIALRVIDVVDETHDTKTLRLDNAEGRVRTHQAGQHVRVCVPGPAGPAWRSFTISSPPSRPTVVELTVKRNPGGVVSPALHTLQSGAMLTIKGPSGRFVFDPQAHPEPLVLAVAGSGVTPAMSILRLIDDRGLDRSVTLLYGCRTQDDIIFARELEALRLRLANLRTVITLSRPGSLWTGAAGRISSELLARHVEHPASARFYLCGPHGFREPLVSWLHERGVPDERIHFEVFGAPKSALPAREVLVD